MKKVAIIFIILTMWSILAFGKTFEDILSSDKILIIAKEITDQAVKNNEKNFSHVKVDVSPHFYEAVSSLFLKVETSLDKKEAEKEISTVLALFINNYLEYLRNLEDIKKPEKLSKTAQTQRKLVLEEQLNNYLKKVCGERPCDQPPCCGGCDPPPCKNKKVKE